MKTLRQTLRVKNQAVDKMRKKALDHALRRATEPRKGAPPIDLFEKEDCPFCHRVRTRLSELGLDYVAHTIPDGKLLKHEMLIRAGGKDQVPFLIDHGTGVKLYESDAILAYLEKEYGEVDVPRRRQSRKLEFPQMFLGVIPRDQFEPVVSKIETLLNELIEYARRLPRDYSRVIIPRRFRTQS